MTQQNLDAILKRVQAEHPGRKIRIAESLPVDRLPVPKPAPKLTELPAADHDALIEQLRGLRIPEDKGLGDTAQRIAADKKHELYVPIRRWLKVYSCRRSEAVKLVNRMFAN